MWSCITDFESNAGNIYIHKLSIEIVAYRKNYMENVLMDRKGERVERLERNRANFVRWNRPLVDSAKEVMQVSGLLLREIHPHARRGLHVCTGNDNSRSEKSRTLLLRDTPIGCARVCGNLEWVKRKSYARGNRREDSIGEYNLISTNRLVKLNEPRGNWF